jgi:hypothetical protein
MYDNFKILNYSNSLVSPELYARHQSRLFSGNVLDGLTVVPKTGLTVTLQPGNGMIPYGSGATSSVRMMSLTANFDITLDTADASNPRIDYIVVYVDMAVSLPGGTPTTANLDGPGVVKATFVKGTPNASPVVPTVGAIQTKIGAANPYFIVAEARVDATVTTIASNKITDRRALVGPAASVASNLPANTLTNAMLSTTAGEVGGAWQSWTPTTTNLTLGNGVIVAKYTQVGKTIRFRVSYKHGSTSSIGGGLITLTLPVASIAYGNASSGGAYPFIGLTKFEDIGVTSATGYVDMSSSTIMRPLVLNTAGTYGNMNGINTTTPFAWGTGDEMTITGAYEAA